RGGGPVRAEHFDFGFKQAGSELAGIGDGCGAADKLRIAAVKSRDAAKLSQHVAKVAPENAAVSVQLVENDVTQIFEQARPARVMRQDAGVQHVRIGQDDVAFLANGSARIGGSVAVVGENAEAVFETLVEVVKLGELVLRKRFGPEKVQRAGVGIFERGVQNRQVVTKCFSGSCRRHDHDILSGVDSFGGGGLVGVRATNAFGGGGGDKGRMHPGGEVCPLGFARGKVADGSKEFAIEVSSSESVQDFA